MPLKPVRKLLVSDGILEQIRGMVHSGELSPGQRLLSETKLAEQLSVSRSSLREALNALIHLNYLERRNKGLFVTAGNEWQKNLPVSIARSKEEYSIAEMIEVRKVVESQICVLAAKRAEQEDLDLLEECLNRMRAEMNVPSTFIESDRQFHLALARSAKNSILADFVMRVQDLLGKNIALIVQKSPISKRSLHYHEQIFEAIRDGNSTRARRLMTEHLTDIEKAFVKILYQSKESS
jgi:GntR family transcriptional repressor for pyruvate dehydrogenase complex